MLTPADYAEAAELLNCDVAAIRAVDEVESRGRGFQSNGMPVILYEPHIFHRYTAGRFDVEHPDLSYPKWKPGAYGASYTQWPKFLRAYRLDADAAVMACSWGRFQLMGFNHKACGFETPFAFREAMERDEREHLLAFCRFVQHAGLADELRRHDWKAFAKGYNGVGYAVNKYDSKLASAFAKHSAR